jgi:cbb3-type cytochrome oxidase maturation protein
MYFPYFIAYITIGLVITLILFFWALRNGQFQDQQRARFLPLRDDGGAPPVRVSRWGRWEMYALFFLMATGLAASAAVLMHAAYFAN